MAQALTVPSKSSCASRGSLHGGASFQVEKAAWERVWRTAKYEVKLWPPSSLRPPLSKGPCHTNNTTTIAKILNYYAVVFLLRPPHLLRCGPFCERQNVRNSQENGVRTRCAAIVNQSVTECGSKFTTQSRRSISCTVETLGKHSMN